MNTYNPDKAPDPARWLALDEQRRIQLAEKYHRAARTRLPNLKAHAIFHAIASVLAAHLRDLSDATTDESDSAATYTNAIEKLTAGNWRGS